MQIGKNVYVNIKIQDLNIDDFLKTEDLVDLQIVETAGTSLPIVYAAFLTDEQKIINHFVRNNTVIVEIGDSKEDCDSFNVSIYSSTPPNNGAEGQRRLVEFGGFIISQDYMMNLETNTYVGDSLLVTRRILMDYFGSYVGKGFKTSVVGTNENEVIWRRTNQSACLFLAETLIHMDISPSFPVFAFDKYGTFHLNSFNSLARSTPVAKFVSRTPRETTEIQYVNNFSIDDYKDMYNLYSGYNKITEVWNASKGQVGYAKSYNEPIIASTRETDMVESSTRTALNLMQSANVHDTYAEAFVYNTNKLVALSSMQGTLELVDRYHKELKPTDLVTVTTGDADVSIDGSYLIDTIRTQVDMKHGGIIHTYVFVSRDNKNNIENYVTRQKKGLKIRKSFFSDLLNAIGRVRVAYAMGKKIIDGTYMKQLMAFAIITKQNLLRSFVVAGVTIDFNSSANLIKSLICVGNSLMNTLTSMIFPANIAGIFRDFIIRKPSLKSLLYSYVAMYVPAEARDLIVAILDSLFDTTNSLNSIARDNKITITTSTVTVTTEGEGTVVDNIDTSEIDYIAESEQKVDNIIKDFENNTTGLNIPFPIITLTESQSLMPDEALRTYIAQQTIANLTNLGYLEGVDKDKFEEILLGNEEIDYKIIEQINKNAGNAYNYKFWGTYNDLVELTSFYIKKCYKDKYRTIPCTKLINATGNTKIFFACPTAEEDLKFYINSTRVDVVEDLEGEIQQYYVLLDELKVLEAELAELIAEGASEEIIEIKEAEVKAKRAEVDAKDYTKKLVIGKFEITLDYINTYGNPIPYTVYYTNKGFNSNSVLFEVKQGGMV